MRLDLREKGTKVEVVERGDGEIELMPVPSKPSKKELLTCSSCRTMMKKNEEESGEYNEVYEQACDCGELVLHID